MTTDATDRRRELLRRRMQEANLASAPDPGTTTPAREPGAPLPLSGPQRRMWTTHRLAPDSVAYNVGVAIDLTGPLDDGAMLAAVRAVVARHEALRTAVRTGDGDLPEQVIADAAPDVEHVDLRGHPESEVDTLARELAAQPFDLAAGGPLRARLVRHRDDTATLVLVVHHIAWDDASTPVFFGDLVAAYRALAAGDPAPEPSGPQYADVAELGDPAVDEAGRAFWRAELSPAPEPLELPLLHGHLATGDETGHEQARDLRPGTAELIRATAREHGASGFMVVLAAVAALVHRYTGSRDFTVGAPVVNRDRPGAERVVGYLGNTVPLRVRVGPDDTGAALVDRMRDTCLRAFVHQDVGLDDIAREVPGHDGGPLFDLVLSLRSSALGPFGEAGLTARRRPLFAGAARFGLTLAVELGEDSVNVEANHPAAPQADPLVTALLENLDAVTHALLTEPGRTVAALELHTGDDARTTEPVHEPLLPDLLAAPERPDAVAVTFEADTLTHAELAARAHALARLLAARGIGPEDRVALALGRSTEMVVATVGVLAAGAAYVPVDPGYPPDRVALMLADSAPSLVLHAPGAELPDGDAPRLALDDPELRAALRAAPGGPGTGPLTDADRTAPLHQEHPAYVIYTSGSTGRPKGTVVPHAALRNHLHWAVRDFPGLAGHTLMHSSTSFDFSITPLLGTLVAGGTLELCEDTLDALASASGAATFLKITPSHAPLLASVRLAADEPVTLVVAGEALRGDVLDDLSARRPAGLTVVNEYGPTEVCVGSLCHHLPPGTPVPAGPVPIGVPVANTPALVLDERLNPVPDGVLGELYLGGPQVARGYLGRPELTAGRFVADPSGPPGARLYRTGDVVRRMPDGAITFLGRSDDQVKVRGHRVEPGEIETVLAARDGVAAAVVTARDDGPGGVYLVGYVTPEPGAAPDPEALRAAVAEILPEHMVPALVMAVDELPLSPSGKVDRKRLPEPEFAGSTASRAPAPGAETVLAGLFAQVLGRDEVGVDDSFFALGGDSIVSIQLVAKARAAGLTLTPRDVFAARTVAALAALVEEPTESTPDAAPEDDSGPVPLTPVMHAFLERGGRLDGHHMSAAITLPDGLGDDVVPGILRELARRHEMLRARLDPDGPCLRVGEPGETPPAERITGDLAAPDTLERARAAGIAHLDPAAGRMLAGVRVDGPGGSALVLVAHHLVVDGVSLRVLVEDTGEIGAALAGGRDPAPATPGTSMRRFTRALAGEAGRRGGELGRWRAVLDGPDPLLGTRRTGAGDLWETAHTHTAELDGETTDAVLTTVPAAFYAGADDVLLAGLGIAVASRRAEASTVVTVEAHGRQEDAVGVSGLDRTVGWFTSQYPVRLDASGVDVHDALAGGPAAGTVLKRVKEHLRSLPDRGLGYGLLRRLNPDTGPELAGYAEPQLAFNYLGRVDTGGAERPWALRPGGLSAGSDPRMPVATTLVLNAVVENRPEGPRLVGHWSWPDGLLTGEEVRALADAWAAALRGLARHAGGHGAGGHSPSDMSLVSLDQGALDAIESRWGNR